MLHLQCNKIVNTVFPAYSDTLGTWEKCHYNQIVTVTRQSLVLNQSLGTCQKCHSRRGVTVNSVTVSGEICTDINATSSRRRHRRFIGGFRLKGRFSCLLLPQPIRVQKNFQCLRLSQDGCTATAPKRRISNQSARFDFPNVAKICNLQMLNNVVKLPLPCTDL